MVGEIVLLVGLAEPEHELLTVDEDLIQNTVNAVTVLLEGEGHVGGHRADYDLLQFGRFGWIGYLHDFWVSGTYFLRLLSRLALPFDCLPLDEGYRCNGAAPLL